MDMGQYAEMLDTHTCDAYGGVEKQGMPWQGVGSGAARRFQT
jgi:hypothetical protein